MYNLGPWKSRSILKRWFASLWMMIAWKKSEKMAVPQPTDKHYIVVGLPGQAGCFHLFWVIENTPRLWRSDPSWLALDFFKWVAKKKHAFVLYPVDTSCVCQVYKISTSLVVKRSSSNSSTQYIASTCTTYIWSFLLANIEQHNYIDNRQFLFDWLSDPGGQLFVECFFC